MLDQEIARAKVNLALHVTGRRADGYHLLDTLVAFPPVGDVITAHAGDGLSLAVEGPGAAALADTPVEDNLVLRAARGMAALTGGAAGGVALRLRKVLPVAAGLGGGSADAAATIRLLARLWRIDPGSEAVQALAVGLGADVPMCLASRPLRARGIGDRVEPFAIDATLGIVLVNPRVPVPTPAIFRALVHRDNPGLPEESDGGRDGLLALLQACRNDLQGPAIVVEPIVATVLSDLDRLEGRLLARMSGSGATCFALFASADEADAAAGRLAASRPDWWIRSSSLG